MGLKNTRLILLEDYLVFLLGLGDPGPRRMFSEPDLFQREFQRRSPIVLDTSMYFSGIGNNSSLGE